MATEKDRRSELTVDLTNGTVSRNGVTVRVRPRMAETLEILTTSRTAVVSFEKIEAQLTGWGDPIERHTVTVHISRCRKAIRPLGCEIENRARLGWALVVGEPLTFNVSVPVTLRRVLERIAADRGMSMDEAAAAVIASAGMKDAIERKEAA